jgi:hypothetical protein
MYDLERVWYKALVALHVATQNIQGHLRDPADVVNDVFSKLIQVEDGDDRRRMEYTLLGGAMPLEARRQFEEYCVAAKP